MDEKKTINCNECAMPLPVGVYEAGEILIGYETLKPEDLVTAIGAALEEDERFVKTCSGHFRSDLSIGSLALAAWLSGPTTADLVAAYRHIHGGECERTANALVSATTGSEA